MGRRNSDDSVRHVSALYEGARMNSYFQEGGSLTSRGEMLLVTFKGAIESLFDTLEVQDMTEDQIRVLGSIMTDMVADKFSKRLAVKKQDTQRFADLTDEQFHEHLKEKYGFLWMCMSLSEEELARCPIILKEEIKQAIRDGIRGNMPDSPMMQIDFHKRILNNF